MATEFRYSVKSGKKNKKNCIIFPFDFDSSFLSSRSKFIRKISKRLYFRFDYPPANTQPRIFNPGRDLNSRMTTSRDLQDLKKACVDKFDSYSGKGGIVIKATASEEGKDEYNKTLSERRGDFIENWLIKNFPDIDFKNEHQYIGEKEAKNKGAASQKDRYIEISFTNVIDTVVVRIKLEKIDVVVNSQLRTPSDATIENFISSGKVGEEVDKFAGDSLELIIACLKDGQAEMKSLQQNSEIQSNAEQLTVVNELAERVNTHIRFYKAALKERRKYANKIR